MAAMSMLSWAIMVILVVQNAGSAVVIRYVCSYPGQGEFDGQHAVIMEECGKLVICFVIMLATALSGGAKGAQDVMSQLMNCGAYVGAPAFVYWVQNNLRYVGAGCIDASTYFVTFQAKTIWAVFLSMIVFQRYISPTKWAGLVVLLSGV